MLVELEFRQGNVFSSLLEISKFDIIPQFDIYFERAFRIFKDNVPGYEQKIIGKLSSGGIIISDSGFEHLCFDSLNCLEKLPIPEQLSAYGEMVLGRKK